MDKGDLIKSRDLTDWDRIGLVLEHDRTQKIVRVFFYDKSETKILYSRDVQLYKRCPNNKKKLKERVDKPSKS